MKKKAGFPEEGEEGAFDTLEDLIININSLSDSEVSNYLTENTEVQSYYDWWFMVSFLKAEDSAGKNSYQYLPPGDSQKWHYIPWDFNQSYGQSWKTTRLTSGFNPSKVNYNGIFQRLILHDDFKSIYDERYRNNILGTGDPLALSTLLAEVDRLYGEIRESALEDEKLWKEKYRDFHLWEDRDDFTTFEEEVQYIRDWITSQHAIFSAYY